MTTFFGRKKELRQIAELHAKPVPDHISIVGPRSIGKSALLRFVCDQHAGAPSTFACVALVDLRHDPPETMDAVLARVGGALKSALSATADFRELSRYVVPTAPATDLFEQLTVAIGEVAEADRRILLALDGCDPVLKNSAIPRNLWDNLRALGQSKGLRLITGTRRPLHELCYNPESRTSDFFRIFYDQPILLSAFDDEDWKDVYSACGLMLDPAAQKELRNWTGGHPDLAEQVFERLRASSKSSYTKADVDVVGEAMAEGSARVDALWRECSEDARRDIVALLKGELPAAEVPDSRAVFLGACGIAVRSGNKLRLANRLLERKAAAKQNDVSGIRDLFGTREAFDANAQKLLELRLSTVVRADPALIKIVRRAIRDLADGPGVTLGSARDVVDRALDLVWAVEAPDMRSQKSWLDGWRQHATPSATKALDRATREPLIPEERGQQCDILRTITGRQGLRSVARKTTKGAAVLIEHMKQLGDLKNHAQEPVGNGLAVAFCMAAIELCETLGRDLMG